MYSLNNNFHSNIDDESIRLFGNPSSLAVKSFLYMLEMGYMEDDFTYLDEMNILNAYLILYTIEGEGSLVYEDKEYTLKQSSLMLIDCKKFYVLRNNNPDWKLLYLFLNGYQAKVYYSIITKNKVPVFMVENPKTITSLFWQIVGLHKKKNSYTEILSSMHLTRMLTEITLFNADLSALEVENPDYLNDIFYYLKRHYKEKITLDMLSERFVINKFHLAKVFKRYSGTTIIEYIIMNRMDKAKTLLRYTNKSIDDIANEVGFYNASYFIKLFHCREHITPLSYRKLFVKIK